MSNPLTPMSFSNSSGGAAKNVCQRKLSEKMKFPVILLLMHIPLGILLYNSKLLAFVYPLGVFLLGLRRAFRRPEKLERIAWICSYLIGIEVLLRMAQSDIFWEFGKYGTAAIMIVALARRKCWHIPLLPLLYCVFLLPACLLTLFDSSLNGARDKISFNMSGPFLLFIACWFFSYLKVDTSGLRKIFLAMIIPLLAVAVTTFFYTMTAKDIVFNGESNFASSGGYGPNQVSAMLGLGVFLCLSAYLLLPNNLKTQVIFGLLALFFAAQSVMTFSRGGMYNAVGAILILIIFQLQNFSGIFNRMISVVAIGFVFLVFVFPSLDDFTDGKLQDRFEEKDSTNRVEIIESDYQLFSENPILGIGVGAGREAHAKTINLRAASHTEFSRLISEHGIFGILSIFTMFLMTIYNLHRKKSVVGRALVGGLVMWSFLFMTNAGMRLAAPAFIWGMSFITLSAVGKRKRFEDG